MTAAWVPAAGRTAYLWSNGDAVEVLDHRDGRGRRRGGRRRPGGPRRALGSGAHCAHKSES
ncbi:hypothetical protein GCM10009760_14370 [Kitasatospora kazusensis]|uniref:Uncharacterized protein n=1 Tax=Kitasatospora kazusensis TaxID=407974 RepID=A0ABN2Z222_9ACTN